MSIMLVACAQDDLDTNGVNIVEDEKTVVKMSLNASSSRAEASVDNEKIFSNIRVLIFKADGQLVTNYTKQYDPAVSDPSISVVTKSGKNRILYIVANANNALDRRLARVETKGDLDMMQTNMDEFSHEMANKPLLMTTKLTVNITQGVCNLTEKDGSHIKLHFAAAKITLKLIDATPEGHTLNMIGWGYNDGALNTYLFPTTDAGGNPIDANTGLEGDQSAWFNTETSMIFDATETDPVTGKKTIFINRYLFENRRGGRNTDQKLVPPYMLSGTKPGHISDKDSRGKAWYAPKRAVCMTLSALYVSDTQSKLIKIKIFLGGDAHSDYNVARGNNYDVKVTVKGIDHVDVDTNMESENSNFSVQTSSNLTELDSHPGFRLAVITAENGNVTMEVLDEQGRSYNEPGFSAGWMKISPVNFAYHQVKQAGVNGYWQQDAPAGYFVRPRYIPHHSIREELTAKGIGGWNPVPQGLENDDDMEFADATYRMCYKINSIWFQQGVVTAKSFGIYPDEFLRDGGTRTAKIKVTFNSVEERIFTIVQHGYVSIFESDGGLTDLNSEGSLKDTKSKFVVEKFEEVTMQMNPGVGSDLQRVKHMQWGYPNKILYGSADKYRNGFLLTANAVYENVTRVDDKPTKFGLFPDSYYREKYNGFNSNNLNNAIDGTPIPEPTTLGSNGAPYYLPPSVGNYYHPIYRSSAARYCHEKNRDMNGDGAIDESETDWYLPSQEELQLIWITGQGNFERNYYWSSTEENSGQSWYLDFGTGETGYSLFDKAKTQELSVRCARRIN